MAKMGRPRKEINFAEFERLMMLLPTASETASFFDVSTDTLERAIKRQYGKEATFAAVQKRFGEKTKISLRRNMMRMSEKNASMAIWLSKNILGFRDQPYLTEEEVMLDGVMIVPDDSEDEGDETV